MKKIMLYLVVALVAAAVTFAVVQLAPAEKQTRGHKTPEACAQALFTALQQNDAEAMNAVIAFDEMAAGFDLDAWAKLNNALIHSMGYLAPSDTLAIAYNRNLLMMHWYTRLTQYNLSWISPMTKETVIRTGIGPRTSEDRQTMAEELLTQTEVNAFSLLALERFITPDEIPSVQEQLKASTSQMYLTSMLQCWGAQEVIELGMVVSVPLQDTTLHASATFVIPLEFLRYQDRWLLNPRGSLFGALLKMRVMDFMIEMP